MYVLCSILPMPAQFRSTPLQCVCQEKSSHQTLSHYAQCAKCQQGYQRYAISMPKCPSHPRSRRCSSPSINASGHKLAGREAPAHAPPLSTSQIGFSSPSVLILHGFPQPLTYNFFPRSTPPTHHPPALTISITVTTSLSSRGA